MNNDNNNNRGCPNFGELLQNWQLRRELDRERKRRETDEIYSILNLFLGFFVGAFLAGIIMFIIMRSGMEPETAEAFARLFTTWTTLFLAFAILLQITKSIISRIIRWHNEHKKQKATSTNKAKKENDNV